MVMGCSLIMARRFTISLTTHSTPSTHNAPRNGGRYVMRWKVGMNHRPPMPIISIIRRCHAGRLQSSPRNMMRDLTKSTVSGNLRPISSTGMAVATNAGSTSAPLKFVAVTEPRVQRISEVGSPITVKHPPQLAAITMAEPMYMRWRGLSTSFFRIISIITLVVRLSILALSTKVKSTSIHNTRLELRARLQSLINSKQSLLFSTSTIAIVANR